MQFAASGFAAPLLIFFPVLCQPFAEIGPALVPGTWSGVVFVVARRLLASFADLRTASGSRPCKRRWATPNDQDYEPGTDLPPPLTPPGWPGLARSCRP